MLLLPSSAIIFAGAMPLLLTLMPLSPCMLMLVSLLLSCLLLPRHYALHAAMPLLPPLFAFRYCHYRHYVSPLFRLRRIRWLRLLMLLIHTSSIRRLSRWLLAIRYFRWPG